MALARMDLINEAHHENNENHDQTKELPGTTDHMITDAEAKIMDSEEAEEVEEAKVYPHHLNNSSVHSGGRVGLSTVHIFSSFHLCDRLGGERPSGDFFYLSAISGPSIPHFAGLDNALGMKTIISLRVC